MQAFAMSHIRLPSSSYPSRMSIRDGCQYQPIFLESSEKCSFSVRETFKLGFSSRSNYSRSAWKVFII